MATEGVRRAISRALVGIVGALLVSVSAGCTSYITPGRGAPISTLTNADTHIRERMARRPAAPFPARVAVARIQSPNYSSYTNRGYGKGVFSVVTTRDIERDEDFKRIMALPMVAGIAPLNRLVVPRRFDSEKDLRLAAASVQADVLLAYTIDTAFRVDEHDVGPLRLISLGMLPTKEAKVTATASAVLFDVRTGYVYGLTEATAHEKKIASSWTRRDAVEGSRLRAERSAFVQLVGQIETLWPGLLAQHCGAAGSMTKVGAQQNQRETAETRASYGK